MINLSNNYGALLMTVTTYLMQVEPVYTEIAGDDTNVNIRLPRYNMA